MRQHDRLQECSWAIDEQMRNLEGMGHDFRSDRALQIAALSLKTYVPEILGMSGERVRIETEECLSIANDDDIDRFGEASFGGTLARISLQQLSRQERLEGLPELHTTRYDLCLVMTPQIVDPEPVDLVFGTEVWVPLGSAVSIS